MEYTNILTSVMDNIGLITLNHPQGKDNTDAITLQETANQLSLWNSDDSVKCVVIRGRKNFSSGMAVKDFALELNQEKANFNKIQNSFKSISNFSKPIIASVNGYALGIGFDLALVCDIILAADNSKFAYPEISLNLVPCFGGIQRLARIVGKTKTMEAVLTGRAITVEEAERCGIVSRVVPSTDLLEDTLQTAKRIANQSTKSIKLAKISVNAAFSGIDNGIDIDRANGELCLLDVGFKQSLLSLQKNNE